MYTVQIGTDFSIRLKNSQKNIPKDTNKSPKCMKSQVKGAFCVRKTWNLEQGCIISPNQYKKHQKS